MEFVTSILATLLSFLLFVFTVLKIGRKSSGCNAKTLNLPPGPLKLPLIGNLHQLSGDLPFRRLKELAKTYGPFMHLQLGHTTAFAVFSTEYAEQVFKTHGANFVERLYTLASHVLSYNSSGVASTCYGAYWREVRKVNMLGFLTMKKVQSFQSVREEEMLNLINWIALRAGTPINFPDLFPSISILHWLTGFRFRLENLKRHSDEILETLINEHKKDKKATLEIGKSCEENLDLEDVVDVLLKA
ncbi:hypothetical protein EZV62_024999 [Acer yangbiense]|uniref:Cytochrome P450 n=1 Tax=Acer yangbiense TaxID=1000413 RepID=A0A5C7GWE6_9ROSI|nr:hypothetical protein EZV62_024999 [Acer yangbiense]